METISNSDDQRTHKFSKYLRKFEVPYTLNLQRGENLDNVEIAYAIKCGVAYDHSICKGDGDQDRPSQIRSCEMTEKND